MLQAPFPAEAASPPGTQTQPPPAPDAQRQALCEASAALDAAERNASPFEMSQALAGMAQACLGLRKPGCAESYLQSALRWARGANSNDQVVDLLCQLSEAAASLAELQETRQRGSGRAARDRARDHVFEASTQSAWVADAAWESTVLLRLSDVLHRCGDADDAQHLQTRALRLMGGGAAVPSDAATWLPGLGRLADD